MMEKDLAERLVQFLMDAALRREGIDAHVTVKAIEKSTGQRRAG